MWESPHIPTNMKECAKLENAMSPENKPLFYKGFLPLDVWSIKRMYQSLTKSDTWNQESLCNQVQPYKVIIKKCIDQLLEEPVDMVPYVSKRSLEEGFLKVYNGTHCVDTSFKEVYLTHFKKSDLLSRKKPANMKYFCRKNLENKFFEFYS